MSEWISVKDKEPENGQMIAACIDRLQTGCVCRYCKYENEKLPCLIYGPLKCLGFTWNEVTHWMPLPPPPKDDDVTHWIPLPLPPNDMNAITNCDHCGEYFERCRCDHLRSVSKPDLWVDVKTRLPQGIAGIYRVKRANGNIVTAYYHKDKMNWLCFYGCKTSHWQCKNTCDFLFDVVAWTTLEKRSGEMEKEIHQAGPEMKLFFEKLLDVKAKVLGLFERTNCIEFKEIYDELDAIIKENPNV